MVKDMEKRHGEREERVRRWGAERDKEEEKAEQNEGEE